MASRSVFERYEEDTAQAKWDWEGKSSDVPPNLRRMTMSAMELLMILQECGEPRGIHFRWGKWVKHLLEDFLNDDLPSARRRIVCGFPSSVVVDQVFPRGSSDEHKKRRACYWYLQFIQEVQKNAPVAQPQQ